MNQLKKFIIGVITTILVLLSGMLFVEYRFFNEQAQQLMQLQDEYRNYMQTVKTIVDDYAKNKERLVLLEEVIKGEKKNPELVPDGVQFGIPFPEGVQVFSSDDVDPEPQEAFLVVNRELEYLKDATIAHIKETELASLLDTITLEDWRDYSERLLEHRMPQAKKKRRVAPKAISKKKTPTVYQPGTYQRDMIFSWPIDRSHFWLSSFYGPRKMRGGKWGFHHAIDMAAIKGTSVMAAAAGRVIEARKAPGYGNTILIEHNNKYKTRYAHLKSMFVRSGQEVARGALIGSVGDTGHVRSSFRKGDPSHLHFELHVFGKKVNPMHFLG